MKLSKDLLETWQGMIDYGTGGFDIFKIIEDAAKEAEQLESRISALEFDTKPLTREELEMVLKEKCWTVSKMSEENSYCTNENKSLAIINDKIYAMQFDLSCPLSAVTRATLRSCGVIK